MISITGRPEFQVPLTIDQLNILISLALHHPQAVCRSAVKPPEGFLLKARERLNFSMDMEMDMLIAMSWLQLDTCINILDCTYLLNSTERILAEAMRVNFVGALDLAQEVAAQWKATFQLVGSLHQASDDVL